MSSSASPVHPSSQPTPRLRQQWEIAVLTARLPARIAPAVVAALLAPGPTHPYAPRPFEPMQRYDEQVIQHSALGRLRVLLREELRQGRCLVWTPLAELGCLKRNAPLAVHAARLRQLAWELERRRGVSAAEEVRRAVTTLC